MSNEGSSGSSNVVRERVRVVGVPKKCWCGEQIVAKLSKSDSNPCRRYFRCEFAASKKLANDNHCFKWVDEALLDEVEKLSLENERLKKDIKELREFMTETTKQQKVVFEMVEDALLEAKVELNSKMKTMVIGGVVVSMVLSIIVLWSR